METTQTEQRAAPRVPVKGVLALHEGERSVVRYNVVNLSRGGTLLSSGARYPVGRSMQLSIVTPDLDVFEVRGEVVRPADGGGAMALKFRPAAGDAGGALEELMRQVSGGVGPARAQEPR